MSRAVYGGIGHGGERIVVAYVSVEAKVKVLARARGVGPIVKTNVLRAGPIVKASGSDCQSVLREGSIAKASVPTLVHSLLFIQGKERSCPQVFECIVDGGVIAEARIYLCTSPL